MISLKYFLSVFKNVSAHSYLGKPKIPLEIAGNDILCKSNFSAIINVSKIQFSSTSISFSLPPLHIGPTACITILHGKCLACVHVAFPYGKIIFFCMYSLLSLSIM